MLFALVAAFLAQSISEPEAHYRRALELRERGDLARAIGEMQAAVKLQPRFELARLALGLMLQQSGDVAGAIAQYRAVIQANPKSAEAHNWLGVAHMQKNQFAEAAAALRAAVRLKPDFARAYNNLGSTLAQSGDLDGGVREFERGLKHAPEDLALRLNLGTALRNKGETDAALEHFRFVAARNDDNHEVHYQIGLALRERGDLGGALRAFETALDRNPEYQEGYYALGQVLRQLAAKLPKPAEPSAETRELLNKAGEALARRALSDAVAYMEQAAAREAGSAELHYNLGAAYWHNGDRTKAAKALEAALARNPAHGAAAALSGVAYREAGELATAQLLLQHAIALQPKSAAGFFDLGLVFLRAGRKQQATGQFEAGLNLPGAVAPPDLGAAVAELRPSTADEHVVRARMMGLAGMDAKAVLAEFEAALKLDPQRAQTHNYLGLVHTQLNDDARAAAAFREAIRLRPDYADAHGNLGALLTATDAAEAVRELEKAVALQPALWKAQYNLGIAYGSSPAHGVDREIAQLRKVLAADTSYPRAHFSLGKALLRKGTVPEAVTHLERAVQAEPSFGEARYQLGLALNRAGRGADAAEHLNKGREMIAEAQREQTAALDMREGQAALEKGDMEQAASRFRQVLNVRPDWADARRGLAMAERAQSGDDPRAMQQVESLIRDGSFKDAEAAAAEYVKSRPKSTWGWYALGYAQFAQRRIGDSINSLAKSLSLDVTNAEAHKVLGRNLMIVGRFPDAQREFELGEKYNPRSAEMPFNLGRLHSIQDQWPAAKQSFERALRIDPLYMEAHDGLGFALESLGEDAAAVAAYEKAAALNAERKGTFAAPLVNLAAYHLRHENPAAAHDLATRAVSVNPQSDRAWFQLARAREQRNELEAAVDALQRAIAINARASSYYYVLGTVYRRLGKQAESQQAMEVFGKLNRESNELEQKRLEMLRQ